MQQKIIEIVNVKLKTPGYQALAEDTMYQAPNGAALYFAAQSKVSELERLLEKTTKSVTGFLTESKNLPSEQFLFLNNLRLNIEKKLFQLDVHIIFGDTSDPTGYNK